MKRRFLPGWLPGLAVLGLSVAQIFADVTSQEQLLVYELNRARNDPVRYQLENSGIVTANLTSVAAQMPLALNSALIAAAQFRAQDMAVNNYCAHQSPITGFWPNFIVRSFGYPLPVSYPDNQNNIESIFCKTGPVSTTNTVATTGLATLIEDDGFQPPGHRIHLLAMSAFFQTHREIGAGIAAQIIVSGSSITARSRLAIETAVSAFGGQFLTGVVYNDLNHNLRYDLNEGMAGVSVVTGNLQTQTGAAGGWVIPVNSGNKTVFAFGGGFSGVATAVVAVADKNIEIDFRTGEPLGEVNFADQVAHANLSITSTVAPSPVTEGAPMTYTYKVRNNGPNTATDVVLSNVLPAEVSFVSATTAHGSCTQVAGVVTCALGILPNAATATASIIVTPEVAGPLCSTATVSAAEADPVPTNDTDITCVTVEPPFHDLAIIKIKAPKKITLTDTIPSRVARFSVTIQNLGNHVETIPNMTALTSLVSVEVLSLDTCPDIVPVLLTPKARFPINLLPKKKLTLAFQADIGCPNDPLPTTKIEPHNDYSVDALVQHEALDGNPDSQPANDACPHNPFGTDKGCGSKTVTGSLGGEIFIDVVVK